MRVKKLPRPTIVGVESTAGMGAVGIVGLAAALDFSGMSVTV